MGLAVVLWHPFALRTRHPRPGTGNRRRKKACRAGTGEQPELLGSPDKAMVTADQESGAVMANRTRLSSLPAKIRAEGFEKLSAGCIILLIIMAC